MSDSKALRVRVTTVTLKMGMSKTQSHITELQANLSAAQALNIELTEKIAGLSSELETVNNGIKAIEQAHGELLKSKAPKPQIKELEAKLEEAQKGYSTTDEALKTARLAHQENTVKVLNLTENIELFSAELEAQKAQLVQASETEKSVKLKVAELTAKHGAVDASELFASAKAYLFKQDQSRHMQAFESGLIEHTERFCDPVWTKETVPCDDGTERVIDHLETSSVHKFVFLTTPDETDTEVLKGEVAAMTKKVTVYAKLTYSDILTTGSVTAISSKDFRELGTSSTAQMDHTAIHLIRKINKATQARTKVQRLKPKDFAVLETYAPHVLASYQGMLANLEREALETEAKAGLETLAEIGATVAIIEDTATSEASAEFVAQVEAPDTQGAQA